MSYGLTMFWSVEDLRFENWAHFFSHIFLAAKHTLNFSILDIL